MDREILPSWDLQALFAGMDDPEIGTLLDSLATEAEDFAKEFKGKLGTLDGARLGEAIRRFETLQEQSARLMSFAQLTHSENVADTKRGQFLQNIREALNDLSSALVFFSLELNGIADERLSSLCKEDKGLQRYAPWLEIIRSFRPYQLSAVEERLLHEKSVSGRSAWVRLFDETEARLRFDIDGEAKTLADTLNGLSDRNSEIRRKSAWALGEELNRHNALFATITNTLIKDKEVEDKWRGFKTPVSRRNLENRIDDPVVDMLVKTVRQAFPRLSHRYYRLKAGWMGKKTLPFYDRLAPFPESSRRPIPWLRARETVLGAYRRFSPVMAEIAERFFEERWIDAEPRPGKLSGAFSHPTVPSAHPYILMNYHGKPRDVMTLAHELGHGIHQSLAAGQGFLLSDTPLTLAETASVFGERLTFETLLARCETTQERRVMLVEKIEDMLATITRQIAFFEFERRIHHERRQGEIEPQRLNEIWLEVSRESLGDAVEIEPEIMGTYWSYVPHFIHTPFYVYAYAFGECLVNSLYARYLERPEGFADLCLDLFRAGGSVVWHELLKPFGLDPADENFWASGLLVIENMLDELETLL